jgi:hypothetical protein
VQRGHRGNLIRVRHHRRAPRAERVSEAYGVHEAEAGHQPGRSQWVDGEATDGHQVHQDEQVAGPPVGSRAAQVQPGQQGQRADHVGAGVLVVGQRTN